MTRRPPKWLVAAALALPALVGMGLLWLAVFGWNWARGPLQDLALRQTGRALHIDGDLALGWGWPAPRVQAQRVSFANPAWAAAPQMVAADALELTVDLGELLRGRVSFPQVKLTRPHVHLEQGSGGRKTWLLDRTQTDEDAQIRIGHLTLDRGEVSYSDVARGTAVQATLSTVDTPAPAAAAGAAPGAAPRPALAGVAFKAQGRFQGQTLVAVGRGGPVLALRDDARPYPLQLEATLGRTHVSAEGTVTNLVELSAVDLRLALRGDNLAALFPVVGIALPPTPAYRSAGHLVRQGAIWRYEAFTGTVGRSDMAGTLQLDVGGTRPRLSGAVASRRLDLADLGPAVGARDAGTATAAAAPASARLLPDQALDTAHWATVDADVTFKAQALLRDKALPLENLEVRLVLDDRRLTLDPLDFALAGGRAKAQVTLDGRAAPLRAQAKLQLRGVTLGRLLPTVDLGKASVGLLQGDIDLAGQGASVGRMLATADGRVSLVVRNGEISRLLMEKVGLHLLEILQLRLTGDQTVQLRCAVADFGVTHGVMQAKVLVLDTAVNTVVGSGRIDLARETFDLTFVPRTKVSSLVAFRSPFHVTGSFARPSVRLDTGSVAARAAGSLGLALLNPLLALIPLFEAGPGADDPCAQLAQVARTAPPKSPKAAARP